MPPGRRWGARLAALLVALPGAVVTPLLTAEPAAAASGGTVCLTPAAAGVHRWDGGTAWPRTSERGTAEETAPCAAGTTGAEGAADAPPPSSTGARFDLDTALSDVWDDPGLTPLERVLLVQYLTAHWTTTVGQEANARKALADAYSSVLRPL
ncbi:hypothetical protein [Streptomyces sp. NPDC090026]|uniref:hypothetical protein n=1 Tax=Streptomyces sp. NPDC090026 TaxID=3365923 RepID=UPI0038133F23